MTIPDSDRRREVLVEVEKAYAEWGEAILRFAVRLCGNRDDGEDALVETFAEAFRQWDAYRGKGSRLSWLYGIAANRVRMNKRKARSTPESLDDNLTQAGSISLDLILLREEIAKLPIKQREAFLLVKGEGLTAREVAEALGRPIGTVLYDVHRATHTLRGALNGRDPLNAVLSYPVEP